MCLLQWDGDGRVGFAGLSGSYWDYLSTPSLWFVRLRLEWMRMWHKERRLSLKFVDVIGSNNATYISRSLREQKASFLFPRSMIINHQSSRFPLG